MLLVSLSRGVDEQGWRLTGSGLVCRLGRRKRLCDLRCFDFLRYGLISDERTVVRGLVV